MADAIRESVGVNPELIAGAGGIFDVHADGRPIFSKHAAKRFPEHDEVIRPLKGLAGQAGRG